MIYVNEKYNTEVEFPRILAQYFEGLKIGVFDIETTGLSPDYCAFILGGLGTADGRERLPGAGTGAAGDGYAQAGADACKETAPEGVMKIEQFFAESRYEEEAALDRCMEALSGLDAVITYNGTRFDMPFVKARAARYGLDSMYDTPHNLDLYHIINKFSELRKVLPNLKQKTVENFFGLWNTRTDEIDGGESVALYERWERRGERDVLEKILLHNSDDVRQLTRLTPIVKKADVHRAMSNIGFPVKSLSVKGIRFEIGGSAADLSIGSGGRLTVSGVQRKRPLSYYSYDADGRKGDIAFDDRRAEFSFTVPLRRVGDLTVIDLDRVLPDHAGLSESPFYESGFLVVKQGEEYKYAEINHFIRLFLTKVLEELA